MFRRPLRAAFGSAGFGPAMAAMSGIGLLSIMDAVIKHVSADHSTPQIALMRYVCGTLIAFAVFRAMGTPWPSRATLRPHIWRSLVVAATALTFFYALAVLPLAVVLALSFTAPIFIALFAALLLGERPDRTIISALVLGFAGVLVVLWHEVDGAGAANAWGLAAALTSAVTYALSMVALKSRAAHDPLPTIVLLQNLLPGFIIAPLAATSWTAPAPAEFITFFIIGALGTGGHLLMASAYKRAEASRLGVFEYTAFIWAVGIGFFAFAEVPSLSTLAGAALIVGGALIASRRVPPAPEPEVEIGP
ncbi:DMT family transporter [Ancylobacter radicis]|uniref:DMT family transporter n=1 Tax=Ancylobacter radicis TaxID=2836179 RepID=A0ABS5R7C9_9HYPH|nr:DMT family transporter [Ancylobacter radicis]MBS9477170.1 DMT family transporter [Ancylobacter radicis]